MSRVFDNNNNSHHDDDNDDDDDDDDDNLTLQELASKRRNEIKSSKVKKEIDDDDSISSDEELSLQELAAKRRKKLSADLATATATTRSTTKSPKKGTSKKSASNKARKSSTPKKSSSSSKIKKKSNKKLKTTNTSSSYGSSSLFQTGSLPDCKKFKLVASILKRRKYAFPNWPGEIHWSDGNDDYIQTNFTGVFIGVQGDVIGQIVDKREMKTRSPVATNLIKLSVPELKTMLKDAITKQMDHIKDIPKINGEEEKELLANLKSELSQVEKLGTDKKIESEYLKLLKG